jgi:hypothetical protein
MTAIRSERAFGRGFNVLPTWKERMDARCMVPTPNADVQVTLVGGCPGAFAVIGAAMAQQHRFELLPRPKASATGILSSARQVTDRLIALIGQGDFHEIAGARLPSQQQRIEPIGFDVLFDGLPRDMSGGDDLAPPTVCALKCRAQP